MVVIYYEKFRMDKIMLAKLDSINYQNYTATKSSSSFLKFEFSKF